MTARSAAAFVDTPQVQRGLAAPAFRIMYWIMYRDGSWPFRLQDPSRIAKRVERGMVRRARRIVFPATLAPVAVLPGLAGNHVVERLLFPPARIRRVPHLIRLLV